MARAPLTIAIIGAHVPRFRVREGGGLMNYSVNVTDTVCQVAEHLAAHRGEPVGERCCADVRGLLARASRLGRLRFKELTREDLGTLASDERLVTIDVTGVEGHHELTGIRAHGYWIANQRVSSDVLLSEGLPLRHGLARPRPRAGPRDVELS